MTVSVALAVYNGEKYVTAQLDSLLLQTRQPDEVVIIDDCSRDRTPEIVREYIAAHNLDWRFTVSDENSGYIKNFCNCLKCCTGDVVFLCDQDDIWYSEKIERITEIFESDTECSAVNSSFDLIDGDGKMIIPFKADKKNTANHGLIRYSVENGVCVPVALETVLVYNISPGCTCAFRNDIVKEYVEASRCIMPHDWELNIISAKHGGLRFYNVPLTGYRQHSNNTIGLSTDDSFGPFHMRGTADGRLKVFELQKAQCDTVIANCDSSDKKQRRFCRSLERFCRNRWKILYEKKLLPCFENITLYPRLKQVATIHFRGLVGDMVYVLKRSKNK